MKAITYLTAAFLFLLTSSCNKQEEGVSQEEEVRFTLAQPTKASQTGSFDKGDAVGVFATLHGGFANVIASNVRYLWNGAHFEADNPILYKGKPLDFYVYYPYRADNTALHDIRHSITSQHSIAGWQASDFLTAVNNAGIEAGSIPLSFGHKYATLRFGAEEIPGLVGCTIRGIRTHAWLDFRQNTALAEGGVSDIEMLDRGVSEGIRLYEATVPVQDMQGAVFVLRKAGGEEIQCPLTVPALLEEGKLHLFGATLMQRISFGSYPLQRGNPVGAGTYPFGEHCTVQAQPSPGYYFTGWLEHDARVSDEDAYTFQVTDNRILTPTYESDTTFGEWNLSLSASPLTLPREGGTSAITTACTREVYVKGVHWQTESLTSSLSLDHTAFSLSGTTLSVGGNPVNSPARPCTVTASAGGKTATVTVTQNRGVTESSVYIYEVSVSPESHHFSKEGGKRSFNINCYVVTYTYRDGELYSTSSSPSSNYHTSVEGDEGFSRMGGTVTATENTSPYTRTGYFLVKTPHMTASATLSQEPGIQVSYSHGYEISVSPTSHTFSKNGGTLILNITANYCTYTYYDGVLHSIDREPVKTYKDIDCTGDWESVKGNCIISGKNTGPAKQGVYTVTVGSASAGYVSASCTLYQEAGN